MKRLIFGLFFLLSGLVWAGSLELPDVSGWQATLPDFLSYKSGLTQAFYLRRLYQNQEGASIEVLLAGGLEGKKLERAFEGRFELETENYYLRYRQEGRYRVFATYSRPEKKGVYAIFLSKDPVLVLVARYQGLTDAQALAWLKTFNWEALRQKALQEFEGVAH